MIEYKDKFNLEGYKALLKFIKKSKLKFSSFSDNLSSGRKIILRHDIDFCPTRAMQIAQLESKLSISSTYFFLINTEFYNLQFDSNKKILKEILNLGHYIGLHFDASFYKASDKLHLECKREVKILENIINKKVNIVSFHRPSKKILNMNNKIGGLEHTYMDKFIDDIFYCSDSEGRWRYSKPFNIIDENRTKKKFILHLLLHPIWWTTSSNLSPAEKVDLHIKKKYTFVRELAAKNCKPYSKFLSIKKRD